MTKSLRRRVLLSVILFTTFILPAVFGQDSPLKVEIKTAPATTANKQLFVLNARVRNASAIEHLLQTYQCNRGDWNWTTDDPAVHVEQTQEITCKKNPMMYIKLKPGDAYERALSIRVSVPTGETMQSVTFRVGCRIRLEHNLPTELPPYIWSDPVTIKVGE